MGPPASAAASARRPLAAVATSARTPEEPEGGAEGAGGLPAGPRRPVVVGAPRPQGAQGPMSRWPPVSLSAEEPQLRPSVSVQRFVVAPGRERGRGLSPQPGAPPPPSRLRPRPPPSPGPVGSTTTARPPAQGPSCASPLHPPDASQGGCHHPVLHPGPEARVVGRGLPGARFLSRTEHWGSGSKSRWCPARRCQTGPGPSVRVTLGDSLRLGLPRTHGEAAGAAPGWRGGFAFPAVRPDASFLPVAPGP